MTAPSMTRYQPLPPDRPADDVERELLARWEEEDLFARDARGSERRAELRVLRRPADGERAAGHPSRLLAHDQGSLLPLSRDEGLSRRSKGGLGHARPAGRDRGREAARHQRQAADRGARRGRVQPAVPRERVQVPRGLGEAERAHRVLARLRASVRHVPRTTTSRASGGRSRRCSTRICSTAGTRSCRTARAAAPRCRATSWRSGTGGRGSERLRRARPRRGAERSRRDAAPDVGRRILVWTTTPWTLVSNTALAVHPDLDYVELVRREEGKDKRTLILAESRVRAVLGEDYENRWELVRRITGADLVGRRYQRPLDWVEYPARGTNTRSSSARSSSRPTTARGVVHMSPAFGADDYAAGQRHNLAFLQPVGRARRVSVVDAARRRTVREGRRPAASSRSSSAAACCGRRAASRTRIRIAGAAARRCIYYARTSWFVRTTAYQRRDARAQRARRLASAVGRRGALRRVARRTTSTGRSRATATGARRCRSGSATRDASHVECIGSFADLAERDRRAAAADFDPHKPNVDQLHVAVRVGADAAGRCAARPKSSTPGSTRARCRSRSGTIRSRTATRSPSSSRRISSPRASIRRAGGSTRCWRSRPGSATRCRTTRAVGRRDTFADVASPYRAVVVNDLVLDAEGKKMSKSVGNVVDPWDVMSRHGADAVRLFLVASSDVWVPRSFDEKRARRAGGAIPAHAQERVQRHLRAVRELRLDAVGAGSAARGAPGRSTAG